MPQWCVQRTSVCVCVSECVCVHAIVYVRAFVHTLCVCFYIEDVETFVIPKVFFYPHFLP